QHHRGRSIWPLLFFAFLFVLGLIAGVHRTARRGYSYSNKGSGWTIDWGNVFLFWLNLLLSSSSRGSSGGGSSSGGGFSGWGGGFGRRRSRLQLVIEPRPQLWNAELRSMEYAPFCAAMA